LAASGLAQGAPGTAPEQGVTVRPGTRAVLATAEEGARLLSQRDAFVAAMSPFDRSARLQVGREVPEPEYLSFVAKQTLDWSASERDRLGAILEWFARDTARWSLPLPPVVTFVKTTGLEEGRAAYCRGAAVVLPENVVGDESGHLRTTVFHELFHVYSSHHPEMRARLYAILGFELCPELVLPPALARRKLTNPDAPRLDAFIRVRLDGKSSPVAPVILGRSDLYDEKVGGPFFRQMDFRLLVLQDGSARPTPALTARGEPRLIPAGDVPDYLERIGRNTDYIIHPEEILADNFVLLVDGAKVPSPAILEKLDTALRK
jgi:hypothetical protein